MLEPLFLYTSIHVYNIHTHRFFSPTTEYIANSDPENMICKKTFVEMGINWRNVKLMENIQQREMVYSIVGRCKIQ
jgi:hypothetical protein